VHQLQYKTAQPDDFSSDKSLRESVLIVTLCVGLFFSVIGLWWMYFKKADPLTSNSAYTILVLGSALLVLATLSLWLITIRRLVYRGMSFAPLLGCVLSIPTLVASSVLIFVVLSEPHVRFAIFW
jgi:magnesium-transporting ATPase (P-type)